jgi:protein TonB
MAEAGFLDPKPFRPGAAATVILLHGAAITALLLIKNPEAISGGYGEIDVFDVTPDKPPPPPPPPRTIERPKEQVTNWDVPRTDPLIRGPVEAPPSPPGPPPDLGAQASSRDTPGELYRPPVIPTVVEDPSPPAPVREPVRTEARLASGDLQPPYPTAEQRLEREGRVVIRITIGADGRVKEAQRVSATSDAFYQATERHARARWRFRPATVDGQAVEASKTLTVVFRLDA